MSKSLEHQTRQRRRLAGALAGALVFHALLGFLPLPRFSGTWGLRGGSGARSASGVHERFAAAALHGAEVAVLRPPSPPPEPPSAPVVPPPEPSVEDAEVAVEDVPEPTPQPPTPEPTTEASARATSPGDASAAPPGSTAGDAAHGQDEPGGGLLPSGPIEMELGTPRLYKHPAIPAKVLRKRKIDDDVILQLLVGTDGLVRDVRVLRAIPNCEECTQNAVESVRGNRYEAVLLDGRPVEVWTTLSFRFSYRQ